MFKKKKNPMAMECVYAGPDYFSNQEPPTFDSQSNDEKYPMNHAENEGKQFCPNCGSPVDYDSKFCPNCGTRMPEEVIMEDVYAGPDMM